MAGKPCNDGQPALSLHCLQRLDFKRESPPDLLLPDVDGLNAFMRFVFIEHPGMRAEAARKL
ncbi:hypothetical protein OU5_0144 [Pseudomonas mandelii JR-1]|uniref:Uncharacterized protein n=1 Tax=Pseudomonas mandelii JR-1 TaxID=1147786 RepID=A0A024E4H7_9PSED|nr:hypothetical protein OU5_0144 [Pseudomonas mandelii JR-1]